MILNNLMTSEDHAVALLDDVNDLIENHISTVKTTVSEEHGVERSTLALSKSFDDKFADVVIDAEFSEI